MHCVECQIKGQLGGIRCQCYSTSMVGVCPALLGRRVGESP